MKLEYSKELIDFGCDLTNLEPMVRKNVIHFVFEPLNDSRNFVPKYISDPYREKELCAGFALSFFTSLFEARKRINTFTMSKVNILKKIGTHYALGDINIDDGLADEVDKKGHFNLYTFEGIDLRNKFTIIDNIN